MEFQKNHKSMSWFHTILFHTTLLVQQLTSRQLWRWVAWPIWPIRQNKYFHCLFIAQILSEGTRLTYIFNKLPLDLARIFLHERPSTWTLCNHGWAATVSCTLCQEDLVLRQYRSTTQSPTNTCPQEEWAQMWKVVDRSNRVPLISSAPWLTSKNWLSLGVLLMGPCLHPGQDWLASVLLILPIFKGWLQPPSPLHGPTWKIWQRWVFLAITI